MSVSPDFARCMVALVESYPNAKPLTEWQVRGYADSLSGFTIDQVKYACRRARDESRFFPSSAELRQFIEPSPDDAAMIAWTAFAQAASAVGCYASLETEDEYAGLALLQVFGSWSQYCAVPNTELHAKRAEFIAAYRSVRRLPGQSRPLRLQGEIEASGAPCSPTYFGIITKHGQVTDHRRMELTGGRRGKLITKGEV